MTKKGFIFRKGLVFALIVCLMMGSVFVCVVSAQNIIIDTQKGESRFTTDPDRVLPYEWWYVHDHTDGSSDGWFDTKAYPPGRGNGNFWYTFCIPGMAEYKGIWETSLPYSGNYEVFVWLPDPDSFDPNMDEYEPPNVYLPSKMASYKIYHKAEVASVTIDQSVNKGGFTSLGVFDFDTTGKVELFNNDVEYWRCIAFDAIKFVPVPVHDMAVTNVYAYPSKPNVGQSTTIYVTVKNEGKQQENSVPVKAYVDGYQVGSTQYVTLSADQSTTKSFSWTPGTAKTYSVKGEVGIVSGETDTSDNSKTITVSTQSPAKPVLISPLKITPEKDNYYVGDTLTAEFTIKNIGDVPITLDKLLVGGRYNDGKLPNGEYPDFTFQLTTLQPNVPHQYTGTLELTQPGDYHFFIAYYIENPTPEEKKLLDENNWNTCVDLGEGLTDDDRIEDITTKPKQRPTVKITDPQEDEIVKGLITITGTAEDYDGGVTLVEVMIDSGSWEPASSTTSWSYVWDTTEVADGPHIIYARSFDGEDYSIEDFVTVNVKNAVNQLPNPPTNPNPLPGEEKVELNPTLSVDVTDPDGDLMDVSFYNFDNNVLIGTDYNVPSGGTAEIIWENLLPNKGYCWYAKAHDGIDETQSVSSCFLTKSNQPPTCVIELQKNGVQIDEINVGEFFDIYVGDSTDDQGIVEARFSSDDAQDGNPPAPDSPSWTKLYKWDVTEGDWHADTKIKEWSFTTGGPKKVWIELYDGINPPSNCSANIYANFYFVQISDTHVRQNNDLEKSKDKWDELIKKIKSFDSLPEFVLVSGDLVDFGAGDTGVDNYCTLRSYLCRLGNQWYIDQDFKIPIYFCPGNHDYRLWGPKTSRVPSGSDPLPPYSLTNYYIWLEERDHYSFNYSDTHIISLNSGRDGINPTYFPPRGNGLDDIQQVWLEKDLDMLDGELNSRDDSGFKKIIFMHHPVIYYRVDDKWYNLGIFKSELGVWDAGCINSRTWFKNICEQYKVDVVLSGHTHDNRVYDKNMDGSSFPGDQNGYNNEPFDGEYFPLSTLDKTLFVITGSTLKDDYRVIECKSNQLLVFKDKTALDKITCRSAGSPVELHLFDSNGNHTGRNDSGVIDFEIYKTTYSFSPLEYSDEADPTKWNHTVEEISLLYGIDNYKYHLRGTGEGVFNFSIEKRLTDGSETMILYNNISIKNNSVGELFIYNDSVDYSIYMDDDVDEIVDREIQPDEIICNEVPYIPTKPSGPTIGEPNTLYSYLTNTTDPENNQIYYLFDWGDGTDSGWLGPFDSEEMSSVSHCWINNGIYFVRVRAKDIEDHISDWSDTLIVVIDDIPLITTKTVGNPKYGINNEWVYSSTEFNLTATDDLSGVDKTYYRIWYDDEWTPWNEYTINFALSGEGKHYIEYYSVDKAGNVEETHNQTHYVDDTPPHSKDAVGNELWFDKINNTRFVKFPTTVWLNSTDLPFGECAVGCNYTWYDVWYDSNGDTLVDTFLMGGVINSILGVGPRLEVFITIPLSDKTFYRIRWGSCDFLNHFEDMQERYFGFLEGSVVDDECLWDDNNCVGPITTIANVGGTNSGGDPGSGGGTLEGAPIIKCKWEFDLNVLLPTADICCPDYCVKHDACPYEPGLQVKPLIGGDVLVGYYAIVTDPQGVGHIDHVYADVWHPNGEFKYQIELLPVSPSGELYDKSYALAEWAHVKASHADLITYGDWERPEGWSKDQDIIEELEEEEAYLYYGTAVISYCQPAGEYCVGVIAYDGLDMWSEYLINTFWYIPTAAVWIDFDTVDYGDVVESVWQQVGGDKLISTPDLPTVKNIGNVPVFFTIVQDSMGFGKTGDNWNVEYKARLGKDGDFTSPYPPEQETKIPGYLAMCIEDKFDFLIHVIKGFPDGIPNVGTMTICAHIWGECKDWISPMVFDLAPQGVPQNIFP